MHVWYVDAGIEVTPEPVYTHCLVLSCGSVIATHIQTTPRATRLVKGRMIQERPQDFG